MEDRSSLETSDLLRAAVQRAANIRSELVQLREQAFVAAASAQPGGSAPNGQPAAAQVPGAGTPATLALPPPDGGKLLVLPVMLLPPAGNPEQPGAAGLKNLSFLTSGSSGGLPAALLDVGAPSPGALPTGERGAAPKSSGGGGDTSLLSGGSWSIPAGTAAALGPAAWQLGAAQPQHEGLWTSAAAPAAAPAALLPPREGSFDAVLAALQAEADQQQQQLAMGTALGAAAGGSLAVRSSRMRSSPGARHRQAGGCSSGGGSSRSSSRQGTAAASAPHRRCAQPLPTFDRTDAERQLRDKLNQVNAAKRFNDTRQRPATSTRSAASQGVPRLPLVSLSKASSASASQPSSAAGGAQLHETSQFVWHGAPMAAAPLLRSPVRRSAASVVGSRGAADELEGGLNFLPLARDERNSSPLRRPSGSAAATAGSEAAAAQPQTGRRQSHVSLSDLLDSSSRGTAAGTAGSAQQTPSGLRRSSFSAADAASTAAAGVASSAAAAAAEPPPQASSGPVHVAAAVVPGQQQAAPTAAGMVPGEAAAPPMQDTPRQPGAVGRTPAEGAEGAAGGSLMGRLLGRLASPMGKLQSPPATPQDAAASAAAAAADEDGGDGAVPVATEASSTSASSGMASTASSGSPDPRLRSPVRSFPGLPSQQLPGQRRQVLQAQQGVQQEQQQEQQQRRHGQQDAEPPAGQQQQSGQQQPQLQQRRATPSAGASSSRLPTAGSASSIGRKRSTSEVALEEPPASGKKRSPEVASRLVPRASEEWGGSGVAAAAALAAASPPSPVTGLVAAQEGREARALQLEQQAQAQEVQEQHELQRTPQPASKTQRSAGSGATPAARRSPLAERQAEAAEPAGGSRVVVPVVLQHSPNRQRRQPASPQVRAAPAEVQATQQPQPEIPAAMPQAGAVPPAKPSSQPAPAAAAAEAAEAAEAAAADPMPSTAAPPVRPPRPAAPMPPPVQRSGERRPPFVPRLPVAIAAAAAAAEAEQELPSYSHWVSSPRDLNQQQQQREQQQQQPLPSAQPQQRQSTPAPRLPQHRLAQASPQLASRSVLVGRGPQAAAAAYSPAASASPGAVFDSPQAAVSPADLPASALARRVAESAAAASPRILATPRRRLASLEPPTPRCQAAPCLRQDEHGKQLLSAAPDLAGMPGGALLDAMRQGTVVRKAWVRPNFKAGGSVRRMQLAPGAAGRAELLYPHGLFRKPLRFAVRRAVVNCPAWRPGAYIVLDTARGMLRLEPSTAAEYARWVLALNAAFLASGAGAGAEAGANSSGDSSGGSDCRLLPVNSHRWSPAILFG